MRIYTVQCYTSRQYQRQANKRLVSKELHWVAGIVRAKFGHVLKLMVTDSAKTSYGLAASLLFVAENLYDWNLFNRPEVHNERRS